MKPKKIKRVENPKRQNVRLNDRPDTYIQFSVYRVMWQTCRYRQALCDRISGSLTPTAYRKVVRLADIPFYDLTFVRPTALCPDRLQVQTTLN